MNIVQQSHEMHCDFCSILIIIRSSKAFNVLIVVCYALLFINKNVLMTVFNDMLKKSSAKA